MKSTCKFFQYVSFYKNQSSTNYVVFPLDGKTPIIPLEISKTVEFFIRLAQNRPECHLRPFALGPLECHFGLELCALRRSAAETEQRIVQEKKLNKNNSTKVEIETLCRE